MNPTERRKNIAAQAFRTFQLLTTLLACVDKVAMRVHQSKSTEDERSSVDFQLSLKPTIRYITTEVGRVLIWSDPENRYRLTYPTPEAESQPGIAHSEGTAIASLVLAEVILDICWPPELKERTEQGFQSVSTEAWLKDVSEACKWLHIPVLTINKYTKPSVSCSTARS